MSLSIPDFPHAHFDSKNLFGYLVFYYPYDAIKKEGGLTEEQWRNESYSPEILNYKVGYPHYIRFFKKPFLDLVQYALRSTSETKAYLVPVPSSIAAKDPNFKNTPRKKGEKRNRDDRNTVFCKELAQGKTNLKVADVLQRAKTKSEKATWTPEQHAESFTVNLKSGFPKPNFSGAIILVDDVSTEGGTIQGAKKMIQRSFPQSKVMMLALGLSTAPKNFQPVGSNR